MPRYKKHVFICNHMREDAPDSCCLTKGGLEVQKALKEKLNKLGLSAEVRANRSGCLDACQHGVAVVIYPDQIWYGGVKLEDIDEIIEKSILKDEVIERLKINFGGLIPDQAHTTKVNK